MAVLRQCLTRGLSNIRQPTIVPCASMFWEPDRKGGYDTEIKKTKREHIKDGLKMLGPEMKKWAEEWKINFRADRPEWVGPEHGDYEVVFTFDNKETISEWMVTTDRDHNEGSSKAEFILGPNKTALFKGFVDIEIPKDGVVKNAGYCSIKSPRNKKSFQRVQPYDWHMYTHMLCKVRGDGRPYQMNLAMDRYFDVAWNDSYTYPLYTRGGHYWQIAKIPFSKFYLGSKGRIQDKQEPLLLDRISSVGITLADGYSGPFNLEIAWIALICDFTHKEEFAYEMYRTSQGAIY